MWAALLAALLAGCAWKGGGDGGVPDPVSVWTSQPVQMRVYPSSRFIQDAQGQNILEARIELLDSMGDSAKAGGDYRLELLAAQDERHIERLYAWDVTVATLAEQQRYYDRVTRTYLFRLLLDDANVLRQMTRLRVTFTPLQPNQPRLSATLELRP